MKFPNNCSLNDHFAVSYDEAMKDHRALQKYSAHNFISLKSRKFCKRACARARVCVCVSERERGRGDEDRGSTTLLTLIY